VLYPSYVLLNLPPIEPITEHIPDQTPLGKAQRFDLQANESPALPLSYSAVVRNLTERVPTPQPRLIEHISIEQHITVGAGGRTSHSRVPDRPADSSDKQPP